MSKRQSPNEATPIVVRIRMRYTKTGRMRFGSARDFQRALERALRRADVPVAMSGGFNPHPRISYANAVPTGTASLAEYTEVALGEPWQPQQLADAINAGLPDGFAIAAAVRATPGTSLADPLQASEWLIDVPGHTDDQVRSAMTDLQARAPVTVSRVIKNGPRDIPVTHALISWDTEPAQPAAAGTRLRVVVANTTPTIRPADVFTAAALGEPGLATRVAQGPLEGTRVGDPLAAPPAVAP